MLLGSLKSRRLAFKVGFLALTLAMLVCAVWLYKFSPKAKVIAAVKEWANDPESVVLRELKQSKLDAEVWCGEVNGRNRMGGMVGFKRFVFTQPGLHDLMGDTELKRIMATMVTEDDETFGGKHKLFCS